MARKHHIVYIAALLIGMAATGPAAAQSDELTKAASRRQGQVAATQTAQDPNVTPTYFVVNGQPVTASQLPTNTIGSDGNLYMPGSSTGIPPSYNINGILYTAANLPAGWNLSNGIIYPPGTYVPPRMATVSGGPPAMQALPYVAPRPPSQPPSNSPSPANNYNTGNYVPPVANTPPAYVPPVLDTSSSMWLQQQLAAETASRQAMAPYCNANPSACPPAFRSTYGQPMQHLMTSTQAPAVNPAAVSGRNGGQTIMGRTVADPNAASDAQNQQALAQQQQANHQASYADEQQQAAARAAAVGQQVPGRIVPGASWYAVPLGSNGGN